MNKVFLLIVPLFILGCDRYVEDRRTAEFDPIYFDSADEDTLAPEFGAIYQANKGNLFSMEVEPIVLVIFLQFHLQKVFKRQSHKTRLHPSQATPP